MSPHSRFESLPPELLSGILTRCSREELINLAQTRSNLCAVCRKELTNSPLAMKVTSYSLKSWVVYFCKKDTLLTRGARSLDIDIAIDVTAQDLLGAFDDVDPTVFDVNAQPTHPDASRILPLPFSLRKLSLKTDWIPGPDKSSDILLLLLLRSLPERCPHLEELSVQAHPRYPDELDRCIRRLNRLKKLNLHVWNLPNIPNRLSLLPASLIDLGLYMGAIQTQEEVTTTVPWVRGIRKLALALCTPQGTANVLMILSRGGATHLTELILRENRNEADPAEFISLRDSLTASLQGFSLLQSPLHTLSLSNPSAWLDSLHLPLLHTAVASTLVQLSLQGVDACVFPSHLSWPRLQSLGLSNIPKMGYQGLLTEPIFPVLTALTIYAVREIQAPEDLFPALETIKWKTIATPEQIASLIRHDIKRINMAAYYPDDFYVPLWEAIGGHTVDLVVLVDHSSSWVGRPASDRKLSFPGFPNIQEFAIERKD